MWPSSSGADDTTMYVVVRMPLAYLCNKLLVCVKVRGVYHPPTDTVTVNATPMRTQDSLNVTTAFPHYGALDTLET